MELNKKKFTLPFTGIISISLIIFILVFICSLILGAAQISINDVWLSIFSQSNSESITILRELRIPREVGAIAVGSALAVSGAIMQGITKNPLADPGLLGLTAGGNFALAIALAFMPSLNYFGIMITCFIGAALGTLLVFGISFIKGNSLSPLKLVLAGAAISTFLTAAAEGIGLFFKVSKNISMWTSGGLIGTNWSQLQLIIPFIFLGILVSIILSKQLSILSLSEEVAIGLGQQIKYIKAILFIVITILAGASVALVGNMAFIGLMIPHIVRIIVGTDYRRIIPMSAIFGATFMVIADTLGRTLYAPLETSVAAIVTVLGLPFFLFIVNKGGKGY